VRNILFTYIKFKLSLLLPLLLGEEALQKIKLEEVAENDMILLVIFNAAGNISRVR
jgi:hypothetical protein